MVEQCHKVNLPYEFESSRLAQVRAGDSSKWCVLGYDDCMDVNSFDEQAFMDFNQYQFRTSLTARYPQDSALEYLVLGLTSEAGEVAGKLKKIIRDDKGRLTELNKESLAAEVGDVLWYCAQLAKHLDMNLSSIAANNLKKLESRLERGTIGGSGDNR